MNDAMRAWTLVGAPGPATFRCTNTAVPAPGPGEVVVRTRAISLNHRDLDVVAGTYYRSRQPDAVPCSDASGEVVSIGAGVRRLAVGDHVSTTVVPDWRDGRFSAAISHTMLGTGQTPGVLADTLVLPEQAFVPMPSSLSFAEASTLPCAALTAWHALFEEGPLPSGATVLTLGTGGVSVFAIQFARWAGARVVATSSSRAKLMRLAELGAHETIDTSAVPEWGERARTMAGDVGVDHVIEVGGQGTMRESLRAVRPGGVVSLIGVLARPAAVVLTPVLFKNLRIQGIVVGSHAMFERMNAAYSAGLPRPVVDRVYPFDEAPDAFAYLASGRHVGKVVITVDGQ